MVRKVMCLFAFAAAVSAVLPRGAYAGPDPPPGKFGIGVNVNDGSDPNVPSYVAYGDPCVYPVWAGDHWKMRIHGWVSLPNPAATPAKWEVGSFGNIHEYSTPETATVTVHSSFGQKAWTAAGVFYWVIDVDAGWGTPLSVLGFPSGGSYGVQLYLNVTSPAIGAWWTGATTWAYMAW
jgi:hypothetical protein